VSAAPTLYRIDPAPQRDELAVEEVWSQGGDGPLAAGYAHIRPLTVGGKLHLVAIDGAGKASMFAVTPGDQPFAQASSVLDLGGPCDSAETFVLGNVAHLMTYVSESGTFSFFPIAGDLTTTAPYVFQRRREPGITVGFDTVYPAVVNSGICLVGYSSRSGDVNTYTLSVISSTPPSAPGTPPLLAAPAWVHQWARDWVRFAFFQLGGETFFFKTNTGRLNVNIDHVLDDPSQGTIEVGSWLQDQLPDALAIDIVRAFYLGGGDPHFLTYMSDGNATFNRFHGDCQGWTRCAAAQTAPGATEIAPFVADGGTYALFY
jgi:hypothetical protein